VLATLPRSTSAREREWRTGLPTQGWAATFGAEQALREGTMSLNGKALAVVPAYNEEATLGRVIAGLRDHAPAFDILVIDDGSTDRTREVAAASGAKVLQMPFNVGIGGAVQSGFKFALENDYDYMVQVDGDGQHDPLEIDKLVALMQEPGAEDVIVGSRFLKDLQYAGPISRRAGIHVFAFLLSRFVGQKVTDPTSGFRLYNRRAIKLFAHDYPHDYPEVEAVLVLHFHKLRMREVAVRMYKRGGGSSSIRSGKSIYYMVKVLLAIFVGLSRARPILEPGDDNPVVAVHGI
jgi:glycosyltransferase involved in cell wall biosynthesis